MTRCRVRDGRLVGSQELRIRRGDCDPVTVVGFDSPGEVADPVGLCRLVADTRQGAGSGLAGVFQRVGVTPDGSGVVFEVTNAFQLIGRTPLTEEQQGFFHVRADGTGLSRLGPPSRDPTYRVGVRRGGALTGSFHAFLSFSPSGHLVAYTDRGPAPDGSDADQVFTLDVRSGKRTQVTRLPATRAPASDPTARVLSSVFFLDEQSIQFTTRGFDGPGETTQTIRTDGTGLHRREPPRVPQAVSGNPVAPLLGVTRPTGRIATFRLAKIPLNTDPTDPDAPVTEVFRLNGRNVLQLTGFNRFDTAATGAHGGVNVAERGRRVLLYASADPLGENPLGNCQLFSMNELGGGLRQLTRFDEGVPSAAGCYFGAPVGCGFYNVFEDPETGWIVFYSDCDPLGANPGGSQVFAMRPDGRRLRQLTRTAGARYGVGDEVEVEIPGPIAYSVPTP